jgi:hypothetical protein
MAAPSTDPALARRARQCLGRAVGEITRLPNGAGARGSSALGARKAKPRSGAPTRTVPVPGVVFNELRSKARRRIITPCA